MKAWRTAFAILIATAVLRAQTTPIQDPSALSFTAPADASTVTSYRVLYFLNTDDLTALKLPEPQLTVDLGKPAPDASGTITTGLATVCDGLVAGTVYKTVVVTESASGESPYSPTSTPFEWTSAHVVPYVAPDGTVTPYCGGTPISPPGPTVTIPASPTDLHFDVAPSPPTGGKTGGTGGATMGWSLLGHTKGRSTNLNTFTTTPGVDTTGATLIVIGLTDYVAGGGTPGVLSDSYGNTWTGLGPSAGSGQLGDSFTTQIYYCVNPIVGSGHTFTDTGTTRIGSMEVSWWTGNAASPFEAKSSAATNSAASKQPGSITPATDGELVITSSVGWSNGVTASIDSGFTIIDQETGVSGQSGSSALAYLIQTTAAAVNPTWTWTGSTGVSAQMATFKVGAGGSLPIFNAQRRFPIQTKRRIF